MGPRRQSGIIDLGQQQVVPIQHTPEATLGVVTLSWGSDRRNDNALVEFRKARS